MIGNTNSLRCCLLACLCLSTACSLIFDSSADGGEAQSDGPTTSIEDASLGDSSVPCTPIFEISDDFDDNTQAGFWSAVNAPEETGGVLVLADFPGGSQNSRSYTSSSSTGSLRDKRMFVKVARVPLQATDIDTRLVLRKHDDVDSYFRIRLIADTLKFERRVPPGIGSGTVKQRSFDPDQDVYWQLRVTNNEIIAEVGPTPNNLKPLGSDRLDLDEDLTDDIDDSEHKQELIDQMRVSLAAGWTTGGGEANEVHFDNFNIGAAPCPEPN